MALIVVQHSVVDNFAVDPNQSASLNPIYAGQLVGLNNSGFVSLATDTTGLVNALGVAGDSISTEYQTTAYSADLVISPSGAKRWTSNRVSDFYNECLASGMMTVYIGAGRFATDQYVTGDPWTNSTGKKVYSNAAGLFTLNAGNAARGVGYVQAPPTDYPSGVPGVDSPSTDNFMSLGTYLTVHLNI